MDLKAFFVVLSERYTGHKHELPLGGKITTAYDRNEIHHEWLVTPRASNDFSRCNGLQYGIIGQFGPGSCLPGPIGFTLN